MIPLNRDLSRYNLLSSEISELYHTYASKFALSDSVLYTLYVLCENGGTCNQSHIYKSSGLSRQTVNSAVKKLSKKGILYLKQGDGKNTVVTLTNEGKQFANKVIAPLFEIESSIFLKWSEKQTKEFLRLTANYRDELKSGIEALDLRRTTK